MPAAASSHNNATTRSDRAPGALPRQTCGITDSEGIKESLHQDVTRGRLTVAASPVSPERAARPGVHPLGLGDGRDGLLLVPPALPESGPVPVIVALHGAGGTARQMIDLLGTVARDRGVVVVAPDSRGATWDVIRGGYGPDVRFLGDALSQVSAAFSTAPEVTALAGWSDGASYALSLGIANGDVFPNVIAWSPGFASPGMRTGSPRMFVSHGVRDPVLPIDRCSRRLVPQLQRAGYPVTYREFPGAHQVPPEIVAEALTWFLDS